MNELNIIKTNSFTNRLEAKQQVVGHNNNNNTKYYEDRKDDETCSQGKERTKIPLVASSFRRYMQYLGLEFESRDYFDEDFNSQSQQQPAWRKTALFVLFIAISMIISACGLGMYAIKLQHRNSGHVVKMKSNDD